MNPLFGSNTYVPLDGTMAEYCDGRQFVLDDLVDRLEYTSKPWPIFCLDGELISYPSWERPSIVAVYRGFEGVYKATLMPALKRRTEHEYSLAIAL